MNTREYILSGVVESYVLGLASDEEGKEFETMCAQYPEVLEARNSFELSIEKQAIENAIVPPAGLKNKIVEQISGTATVVPIRSAPATNLNWLKYAAAACIILLAGSLYYNLTLSNKNKTLRADNKTLKTGYANTVAKLNDMEKDLRVLQQNPNIKMASMKGLDASPASFATVYWDTASHDVYLMINNMPKPASDKQYQLWALLDGKPIDMGLIEITEKPLQLYRLKKAQSAQAFAVTLEKKGRSSVSAPEGAMYVMGKL